MRPYTDRVVWRTRRWSKSGLYDRPGPRATWRLAATAGEEEYILDLGTTPPSVLTANVENGTVETPATSWQSWLALLDEGTPRSSKTNATWPSACVTSAGGCSELHSVRG